MKSKGILNVFINMRFQWIFDFKACKIPVGNEYGSRSGIGLHVQCGAQSIFFYKTGFMADVSNSGSKNLKITSMFLFRSIWGLLLIFQLNPFRSCPKPR